MDDYLTYQLPDNLSNAGVTDSAGHRMLFTIDQARAEVNPSLPLEWSAAGGVMFYDMYVVGISLIGFENGAISSVQSRWNYPDFLPALEDVPGCEVSAVIAEDQYSLYTAAELEEAEAAGSPVPEDQQYVKMWFVIFAQEDGYGAYALFLNEEYFSKDDMIKLAQSVHFIDGAFDLYDPNLQYSQEYLPGSSNIKGNVDTAYFADKSPDFEIGANRYGYAVFKNPAAAYARLVEDFKTGIDLIQEEFELEPLTPDKYLAYMNLGWQVTTGTEDERDQAMFVTFCMDIYENSIVFH